MANLLTWIAAAAEGEAIESVVIGEMGWGDYGNAGVPQYAEQRREELLTWDQAKPMLDYDFDDSYGAPGCNAIYVWTTNRVLFISQYDGSTNIEWVPRNPLACKPSMPGG